MEKLTILLLVAALLMSTQGLIQEKRQKAKITIFSKRKSNAERWWEGDCTDWLGSCSSPSECCYDNCETYCTLWK
uniref:Conotoxin lt7b n=1 Tax=Conus litteratus TaxID=89445 RepID=B0KZ80_CONLT|nr:conotoxin lt7b [Conus litteratus]